MRKLHFGTLLATATTIAMTFMPQLAAAAYTPRVGDVIRGQTYAATYYIGSDLKRYVFPNEKTYFTWFSNFNSVVWVQDNELANMFIGGNVTHRPGVRMIKIQSDTKTYAVACGAIRWVKNEKVAAALYGANWNRMIDDVPDAFFVNYNAGAEINAASDYNPAYELAHCALPGNVQQ